MNKVRGGVGRPEPGAAAPSADQSQGVAAPAAPTVDAGAASEQVRRRTETLRAASQPGGGPNPPSPLLAVRAGGGGGEVPKKMIGFVEREGGHAFLRPLDGSARRPLAGGAQGAPAAGTVVEVTTKPGAPQVALTTAGALADAGSAKAKLYGILEKHGIDPSFPPAVEAEVKQILQTPGLDDPALEDLTHLPFITIDNADSRDLDQAMCIERTEGGGYKVYYALADAAHYVRPGTALYEEAMKRGVTLYLPGMSVPMLPPELSEGLVSLNAGEDRRALTMVTELDAQGNVLKNELKRTKINSRQKLTYEGVQQMHDARDAGADHPLRGQDFTETLLLLKEVGEARIQQASERDVVRINRREVRHGIDAEDPTRFATYARDRAGTEKWNEQVSLLCNAEGALLMEAPGNGPDVTPIYKVHPEPVKKRLEDFRDTAAAACAAHGLDPKVWTWKKGEELADFLARLPTEGPQAGLTAAIHRQSVMVNQASEFSAEPGAHHGVGVEPYARFSSPMREMVGVYTHKEALEKFGWIEPRMWPHDDALANQAMVVDLANRTKKLQRQIEKDADRLVLDQQLEADLDRPFDERPVWKGTVLGLSSKKAYIQMQDPPFEVKLYLEDLAGRFHTDLTVGDDRAVAKSDDPHELPDIRLGDGLDLKLDRYDAERQRYVFTPVDGEGRVLGAKA